MAQKTYIARKGADADFGALSADSLVINAATINAGAITLADDEKITFGASADVTMEWDTAATPDELQLLAAADDTVFSIGIAAATQKSFDVLVYGQAANGADYFKFDASASALLVAGDSKLDFSGATVLATNTDGGVIKGGTSAAPITEDTASMKFISFYFKDGATSGTAVGDYVKLSVSGAGGSGVAMRPYAVMDTAAGATIHTVQATLGFTGGGTLSGAGNAIYANVMLPAEAVSGTLAAMTAEVFSEDAASDPAGSILSIFRISNAGAANGKADVDDDCYLFNFDGWTEADGNMIATKGAAACPNVTHSLRIRLPDGTVGYIYVGETALTA